MWLFDASAPYVVLSLLGDVAIETSGASLRPSEATAMRSDFASQYVDSKA